MSFRLVQKSVTLNDLERRNGVILRYFSEFAETTQNNAISPFKVIQGDRFLYQSKAHIRFPISA